MFSILLTNKAEKQLKKLERQMRSRVEILFETLETKPIPIEGYDIRKIAGEDDTYRARLSSFRLVYRIFWEKKIIAIAKIERRSETTY